MDRPSVDLVGPLGPSRELLREDPAYPARCLELPDPPAVLYARGMPLVADPPAVAIVGTRAATPYGLRVARTIASRCVRAGACVVSGLARGIDGAAHEAALEAGGRTVAVLGTGADLTYPRSHRQLQQRISREGLLLTEHPDGSTGHGGSFPRRNRIIAALADVTVVVEAGIGSGALITADHAVELGRTVACVPNAIDVPQAAGSNALLKQGAEPVLTPDDVLALLDLRPLPPHAPALDPESAHCWDAIRGGLDDPARIAVAVERPLPAVLAVLAQLEIDGLISFDAVGRVHPAPGIT